MLFCINNQKCIYRVSDASIMVWAPKLYAQTVEKLIQKNSYLDMFKNIGRIVDIQKMPNLIYMQ